MKHIAIGNIAIDAPFVPLLFFMLSDRGGSGAASSNSLESAGFAVLG
jgi:hypothetical protein